MGHLWEDVQAPISRELWHFDTKTLGDPKNHWTPVGAETQVALTAPQEVGCCLPSSEWLRCFRFTAMAQHSGLGLGCFWAAVPELSSVHYVGEWTLTGIATRLHQVRVLQTWQLFQLLEWCVLDYLEVLPEQPREKETKRASAQVRGGHAP